MMADKFENHASSLEAPAAHAAAVTPDNGTDLATTARALYVGGAGNIVLVTAGGEEVTFNSVPAGFILPVRTARVKSTSTTATNIVALW
jgi:hypothetical protein